MKLRKNFILSVVLGFAAAAHGQTIFLDTFDPDTSTGLTGYYAGDVRAPDVGVTVGGGTGGSTALYMSGIFMGGANGWGVVAGGYQNSAVSGNTSGNLSDYVLEFDALANVAGGGFGMLLQEWPGVWTGTMGEMATQAAYLGGSDFTLAEANTWEHFSFNLGGSRFQNPSGYDNGFDPRGQTWQIFWSMNASDYGYTGANSVYGTLYIDNIQLTMVPEPSALALAGLASAAMLGLRRRSRYHPSLC